MDAPVRRWDDVSGARFPAVGVGDDVGGFTVEGLLGAGGCGLYPDKAPRCFFLAMEHAPTSPSNSSW